MPGSGVEVATAYVSIVPNTRGLGRSIIREVGGSAASAGSSAGTRFSGAFGSAGAVAASAAGVAIAAAAVAAITKTITAAASYEQTKIAFTKLLGGAGEAKSFLEDLSQFAAKTPFEIPDLERNAKLMMAYGFNTRDIIPVLRDVGDAASGLGAGSEGIDSIVRALGQMQVKGKVMAEEMNRQLVEVGVPAWKYLAKEMGVTIPQVQKMAEQGLIPADRAIKAITAGMKTDFGGMMAAQSDTAIGKLSNLKDQLTLLARDAGKPIIDAIKPGLDWLIAAVAQARMAIAGGGGGGLFGDFAPQIQRLVGAFRQGAIAVAPAAKAIWTAIGPALKQVGAAFHQLALEVIPTITFIVKAITEKWRQIAPVVVPVISFIVKVVGSNLALLAGIITGILRAIRGDWSGAWSAIKNAAVQYVGSTRSAVERLLGGLVPALATIGRNAVSSFANSIRNGASAVVQAGKDLAARLIKAVKDFLGIHSPSRVFQSIGGHVVGGLVRGLNFGNAMSIIKKFFGGVWGMVGKVPALASSIFESGDMGVIQQMMANVKGLVGGAGSVGRGLAQAWSMVGKPYVWGAMSQAAADCSGLVSLVLNAMGLNYGRLTTATIPGALAPGRGKAVTVGLKPGHTGISVLGNWFEARGRKWGILGPGHARSSWSSYYHPPGFSEGGWADGPKSGYPVILHGRELITPESQVSAGGGGDMTFTFLIDLGGRVERVVKRVNKADVRRGNVLVSVGG